MIRWTKLTRFKRFPNQKFDFNPTGVTFLAGPNNAGKSSLLQALAIWEFCRTVLDIERGRESLLRDYKGQGLGMADDEFSPIALPSLKHLWNNLKSQIPGAQDGYTLKIECCWDGQNVQDCRLAVSLSIANDRLFVKASSNLDQDNPLPRVAYLPPFAGITAREPLMSQADRRTMIGRGLAGGVIRNLLLDMHRENLRRREESQRNKRGDLQDAALKNLRATDPWERLQSTLREVFQCELEVAPFNDLYHNYIRVSVARYDPQTRRRAAGIPPRDLMAEGSGFLQWLSVYTLALNPSVDVILLDEPDAHLHPSLQSKLVEKLEELSQSTGKQALLATHSTEILRQAKPSSVFAFGSRRIGYLQDDKGKIGLFIGLGSDYAPRLDPLRLHGRLLIVENNSDARILKEFANKMGVPWPNNLVVWPWTDGSKERKQFFQQLKREVPKLKALSIRDRDDKELDLIDQNTLRDKSINHKEPDLMLRTWRRRHIESYLLWPAAIARAAKCGEGEVNKLLNNQGLYINHHFTDADAPFALMDSRGKNLFVLIKREFGVEPIDVVKAMEPSEICTDIRVLLDQIVAVCSSQADPMLDAGHAVVEVDEHLVVPAQCEAAGAGFWD